MYERTGSKTTKDPVPYDAHVDLCAKKQKKEDKKRIKVDSNTGSLLSESHALCTAPRRPTLHGSSSVGLYGNARGRRAAHISIDAVDTRFSSQNRSG